MFWLHIAYHRWSLYESLNCVIVSFIDFYFLSCAQILKLLFRTDDLDLIFYHDEHSLFCNICILSYFFEVLALFSVFMIFFVCVPKGFTHIVASNACC